MSLIELCVDPQMQRKSPEMETKMSPDGESLDLENLRFGEKFLAEHMFKDVVLRVDLCMFIKNKIILACH
jgi:hypothetical protein